jgi:hypothetical protein
MADTKTTALTADASPSPSDIIYSVKDPGGSPLSRKVTYDNARSSAMGIARASGAPASSSDTGTTGDIKFDGDYIYICVATNTWKRAMLTTW